MIRKISFIPSDQMTNLIITASAIIIGSVFRNGYSRVGHWITACGLAYYLLVNLLPAVQQARRFRSLEPRLKAHVLIVGVLLFFFVRAFFTIDIARFVPLLLLAIEYLLMGQPKKEIPNK